MEDKEIAFTVWKDGKSRKMKFYVDLYYNSVQVWRFRLYAKNKEVKLEKRLLEKRQPWKILSTNFQFQSEDPAQYFQEIYKILDHLMAGPQPTYTHWKNS